MAETPFEEPPPQARVALTLLGCVLLAGFLQIGCEIASDNFVMRALNNQLLAVNLIKLTLAVLLCVITYRASGLLHGDLQAWKRQWLTVVFFFVLPVVATAILYPISSTKPFHGASYVFWLLVPIAEQLLFSGFIYGQMQVIFGKPRQSMAGAFGAAPLVTAFLFALYFWPALRNADEPNKLGASFAMVQMVLAFVYSAWILNVRRITGTVWPCVINHILINVLIAAL